MSPRRKPAEEPRCLAAPPEGDDRLEIRARRRCILCVPPLEQKLRTMQARDGPYEWPLTIREHLDALAGQPHSAVQIARLLGEKYAAVGSARLALSRFGWRRNAIHRQRDPTIQRGRIAQSARGLHPEDDGDVETPSP